MFRIRTRHVYAEIDRHGQRDEKRGSGKDLRRGLRTHLVVKGYVIDFGDSATLDMLADERSDDHRSNRAA